MLGILAVSGLLAAPSMTSAASFVLEGDYLKVGVNYNGALINDGLSNTGINYDITGTKTWPGYDFLTPGTPWQLYSIGVGGSYSPISYFSGGGAGLTTTDTSSGTTLSALTSGNVTVGSTNVGYSQTISFDTTKAIINFRSIITNTGNSTLTNLAFGTSLDPDQDVYAGGGYATTNDIPAANLVTATAPVTDWTIGIRDLTGGGIPTVLAFATWPDNPYAMLNGGVSANLAPYADETINMAWAKADLGAGESWTLDYQYSIAETKDTVVGAVPEPSTFILLGAGLAGLAFARERSKK